MTMSRREAFLLWLTAMMVLFGATYLLAQPRLQTWRKAREEQQALKRRIAMEQRLLQQAPEWTQRLQSLRARLPAHPRDKDVTADLLINLERLAAQRQLVLASRDVEKEVQQGDLYELAVNCRWEGSLESLVYFLFDLQQDPAMLDISQLSVAPSEKGLLKGSFTVYCSYSRGGPDAPGATPESLPSSR